MNYLLATLKFFQLSGLAITAGGILIVGAITAPVIFGALEKEIASELMVKIFTRFEIVLKVLLGLLTGSKLIEIFLVGIKTDIKSLLAYAVMILFIALTTYILFMLSPKMHAIRLEDIEAFNHLHKLSEKLYKLDFLLALIGLALV